MYSVWTVQRQPSAPSFRCTSIITSLTYIFIIISILSKTHWDGSIMHLIRTLRLPCTFSGVSSLTDVAHAPYIADILTPYQIKAYKKIAILFDSNESASFLRPIYVVLWSPFTSFNSKWFLFFNNPILSRESRYKALKNCIGFFYIRFQWKVMQCFVNRHKETQSKRTGMAVSVNVLRITNLYKFKDNRINSP